jgi:transcriptional regulator with XRE-family HTH domain
MSVHIGKIIKETLKSKNIDVADFAHKINYTRGNAYKIFNKKSIDTDLLFKISKVLDENLFFNYITSDEIIKYKNDKVNSSDILSLLNEIKEILTPSQKKKLKTKNNFPI